MRRLPHRQPNTHFGSRAASQPPLRHPMSPQASRASDVPAECLHKDVDRVLFSEAQLQERCKALGKRILNDYSDKRPLFVTVLTGACTFATDLVRCVQPEPEGASFDFVRASSYGGGTESSGKVNLSIESSRISWEGRHVIIIEDIVDTGRTLQKLRDKALELGAASVTAATLLDKVARRVLDVQLEYVGFVCPDEFTVGYGMDYDEKYRTLPYVGVLRREVYES